MKLIEYISKHKGSVWKKGAHRDKNYVLTGKLTHTKREEAQLKRISRCNI